MAKKKRTKNPSPSEPAEAEMTASILHRTWFQQAFIFLTTFIMYVITMPRTVTMEDSGEFLLSAYYLGIPHPPGYPVYALLSHAMTWLPLGNTALEVHLLNGLAGAGACCLVYLVARLLTGCAWPSALAAIAYGFTKTFWYQALIAEVYATNTFFFFLVFWLAIRQERQWTTKRWFGLGLAYGLSLSNHWPLMVLATPAFLFLFWSHLRTVFKTLHIFLAGTLLGLVPYLYLLLRSQFDPPMAFLGPVRTVVDLWKYILRDYYKNQNVEPAADIYDTLRFIGHFFEMIPVEFTWLGAGLMLIGLPLAWRELPRRYFFALLAAFASSSIFLHAAFRVEYRDALIEVVSVFQLIPFGIAAIFLAYGLKSLMISPRLPAAYARKIALTFGIVAAAAPAIFNFGTNNLRQDTFAHDYARIILEALPENASLLLQGDADSGPVAFANRVEGVRPDVRIYSQSGVFLNDRIFDPRIVNTARGAAEKTIEFIKEKGRVFSTRRLHYLTSLKTTPFRFHFNGLFYDVSEDQQPHPVGEATRKRVVAMADRIHRNDYPNQWPHHRDVITSHLCNFMVLENIPHPLFSDHHSCRLVMARHLAKTKQYEQAHVLLERSVGDFRLLSKAQKSDLYQEYLMNRLNWINSMPGDAGLKTRLFQELADSVKPAVAIYPFCNNPVLASLIEIKAQVNIDIDLDGLIKQFWHCKALRPRFRKVTGEAAVK